MKDYKETELIERNYIQILINGLLEASELNYRKDGLDFESDKIDFLLKAVVPEAYILRFDSLIGKEKNDE